MTKQGLRTRRKKRDDRTLAVSRPPYWTTPSGLYRAKVTHPITGERVTLSSQSLADLMGRRAHWDELRREYASAMQCPGCGRELVARTDPEALSRELVAITTHNAGGRQARMTLATMWRAYADESPREHRRKLDSMWTHQVGPFFPAAQTALALTEHRIVSWLAALEKEGYAPRSVRNAFWMLCAAWRASSKKKKLPKAFAWGPDVRPPPVPKERTTRVLTQAEALAIYRALGEHRTHKGRLFMFAALTGLRNGELAALAWEDLDLALGTMRVRHQALDEWRRHYPGKTRPDFATKGRAEYAQRLHPQALELVVMQLRALRKRGPVRRASPVWPDERTGTWKNNATALRAETLQRAARRAGLSPQGVYAHALRHACTTWEIRAGADLLSTQARRGHASVRTTADTYAHPSRLPASRIPLLPLHLREEEPHE